MKKFSAEQAKTYVEELRKDGFEVKHNYNKNDPYFVADKEGFKFMVDCREYPKARIAPTFSVGTLARVHAWGPDKLTVQPPLPYDWEKVKESVFICGWCGKKVDQTQRVAFANRCCAACVPVAKKKLEFPGWCN